MLQPIQTITSYLIAILLAFAVIAFEKQSKKATPMNGMASHKN